MGLEIVEQVPDLDACIIPVGGGGLIAGSALAIKSLRPNVIIIVSILFQHYNHFVAHKYLFSISCQ